MIKIVAYLATQEAHFTNFLASLDSHPFIFSSTFKVLMKMDLNEEESPLKTCLPLNDGKRPFREDRRL